MQIDVSGMTDASDMDKALTASSCARHINSTHIPSNPCTAATCATPPTESIGPVFCQQIHFEQPLLLACGQELPSYSLMVETYGQLNAKKTNAVLICHALTGSHHASGFYTEGLSPGIHYRGDTHPISQQSKTSISQERPGWWDAVIGPGKAIDTQKFFVVCLNNLGGCFGSSGPLSINPETQRLYGPTFPMVTVVDWVNSQARLADYFGIDAWAAVVGGSLGGMQALSWSIQFPERIKQAVVIASAPKLTPQNIAFNEVARQCIVRDSAFHQGQYLAHNAYPKDGLTQARMLGHITYLSDAGMQTKFGRTAMDAKPKYDFTPEFEVEHYLHHQGARFSDCFDANTYLLMSKALDYFDPAAAFDHDLSKALADTQAKFLVVAFSSDWRFSPKRSIELVDALIDAGKPVTYACIESDAGHDAFLLPIPRYLEILTAYMDHVAMDCIE